MSIIKCKLCGTKVSSNVKKCPTCGSDFTIFLKQKTSNLTNILVLIALILFTLTSILNAKDWVASLIENLNSYTNTFSTLIYYVAGIIRNIFICAFLWIIYIQAKTENEALKIFAIIIIAFPILIEIIFDISYIFKYRLTFEILIQMITNIISTYFPVIITLLLINLKKQN